MPGTARSPRLTTTQATAFDSMAYYKDEECTAIFNGQPEYAHCAKFTPEFFRVFLLQPAAGHFLSDEERKSGAVILSYSYWQQHFAGHRNVIGQSMRLFDRSLPIAGVAPPGFRFPVNTDIWFPANTIQPETASRSNILRATTARAPRWISCATTWFRTCALRFIFCSEPLRWFY